MISPWERSRRQLGRREYMRVNNIEEIQDKGAFVDWFGGVFLVDEVYKRMVEEEIGKPDNPKAVDKNKDSENHRAKGK